MLSPKLPLDRAGDVSRDTLVELGDEVFRRLVDSAADYAIFLLTPSGIVATWNAGAERIKGYAAADVIGHHFSIFYTPESLASDLPAQNLRRALADGRLQLEDWRVRKDGSRFRADVIISPLYADNGRLLGFSKITRDLTQRLRVEQLEQQGQRVSQFIATLSHELRSPLSAIQQAVTVLEREPARTDWCTALVRRQVGQLRRLVDDLLDVSRISTGKIRFLRSMIDLNAVVREAVEASMPDVEVRGHELIVRIAAEPAHVFGDPQRLMQVVVNLLHNAAKYTPAGGRIAVSTTIGDGRLTLQVADSGVGMTEGLLQHAFEPYVQGEPGADRAEGGLGLGLPLVKAIVEFHGGTVVAASPGKGLGTTMTVKLPLHAAIVGSA